MTATHALYFQGARLDTGSAEEIWCEAVCRGLAVLMEVQEPDVSVWTLSEGVEIRHLAEDAA